MQQLRASNLPISISFPRKEVSRVLRVSRSIDRPMPLRAKEFLIHDRPGAAVGFGGYGTFDPEAVLTDFEGSAFAVQLPESLAYLSTGDVISINLVSKQVSVLYRRSSPHNSFLLTERCNHFCLMCSQPPKDIDDSWLGEEVLEAIPLISEETEQIGLTGGEPTLLGDTFFKIVQRFESYLPQTHLHILSNGRAFSRNEFAHRYAALGHTNAMLGIPIYSDMADIHNYIVQADCAFDETVKGILNLKRLRQKVEVRVVIHQQNYKRLPRLAEYLSRNLMMVDHVALMGLEIMGFTRANLDILWIDPFDYQEQLEEAADILENNRMSFSIYNHPLCIVPRVLWRHARKSISDWKNEYDVECSSCDVKDQCGGFFASAKFKRSEHIKAIRSQDSALSDG